LRGVAALPHYIKSAAHKPGSIMRGMKAKRTMEKMHPTDRPHWYLSAIGVAPDHQGKGIGGALIRDMLGKADESGVPAFLETSNAENVPLYEHLGFQQIGQGTISGNTKNWAMMRDPMPRA
jgi:ribosomal protein S18 acetylase RimI-like enzyme